jgi:hypothetical protein
MSMRGAIETRISEFLAADDPKLEWVKPAARKHAFLPLYVGWVAVLGVRPDGSFVRGFGDTIRNSMPTRAASAGGLGRPGGSMRQPRGRYQFCGAGPASWHGFAYGVPVSPRVNPSWVVP